MSAATHATAPRNAPARGRRLAGWLLYLLAVALFCEGSARLALRSDTLFRRIEGRDAASWRLRFVRRHAHGTGGLYYTFDVHHPTRGWALRPGLVQVPAFEDRPVSSNSQGLRGRREYAVPKPSGVQRVLVLGDSFTFGDEVGDEETYCHYLQGMLPAEIEILNLGVHGYGHDQMLLYLQEVGARYRPDVVLLGFVAQDMERNLLAFRDFAKPHFNLGAAGLRLAGTPVPTPEALVASEWRRLKLLDLFTMLADRWAWRSGANAARMERLTVALLDELQRTTLSLGAVPAYAYLPVYGELDRPDLTMTRSERFLLGYCRARGIQSLYLQRFFLRARRAGSELKTYGHWSPVEHRIAAQGMHAYLVEKGLVRVPATD